MKKGLVIIGLILASITGSFAQQLSARLDVGGSKLLDTDYYDYAGVVNYSPKLSGNFGLEIHVPLNDQMEFNSDLLISRISGNLTTSGIINDTNFIPDLNLPFGDFSEQYHYHYYYVGIQPNLAIGFKRVKFFIGSRISLLTLFHGTMWLRFQDQQIDFKLGLGDRRQTFDYGYITGLEIVLSNKFNVKVTYYRGLQDLIKYQPPLRSNWERHSRQLTVGVSYLLKDHSNQPMRTKEKLT